MDSFPTLTDSPALDEAEEASRFFYCSPWPRTLDTSRTYLFQVSLPVYIEVALSCLCSIGHI